MRPSTSGHPRSGSERPSGPGGPKPKLQHSHEESRQGQQSQATELVQLSADCEFWCTPDGEAFATLDVNGHSEHLAVRSKAFKSVLAKRYYDASGGVANSESLASALNNIEANAMYSGMVHPVFIRVGEHGGKVYLDLCDAGWRVIEIDDQGWRVITKSPVKFRRSRGMLPLPEPVRGAGIQLLRKHINVDDVSWYLIIAWLAGALKPTGPYPVLALFAQQGSGKSTTARLLRSVLDPNAAPLRADPRSEHDLIIAASNSLVQSYDNLSSIPQWLSDAICRLSTGGGFARRELYSDRDEVIFDCERPVMLTSIEEVATRSDLLDRCLIVELPTLDGQSRRPESRIIAEFEADRSAILGGILDGVSSAIKNLHQVNLEDPPRMADFAYWVTAAEQGLGWPHGTFMTAYNKNRESANGLALEASIIGRPLLDLLEQRNGYYGSATELLADLSERVGEQRWHRSWPKDGRALSGQLRRVSTNLRSVGWEVEFTRQAEARAVTITRIPAESRMIVPSNA